MAHLSETAFLVDVFSLKYSFLYQQSPFEKAFCGALPKSKYSSISIVVSLNLLYRKVYLVSLSDLLVQSLSHGKLQVVSPLFTSSSISLKNRTEAYITLVTEMQLLLFLRSRETQVVSLQFTSSSISLKNRTEAYITLVTEMQLSLFLRSRETQVVSLQFTSSSISLRNRTEAYITLVTEMQLLLFLFPFL